MRVQIKNKVYSFAISIQSRYNIFLKFVGFYIKNALKNVIQKNKVKIIQDTVIDHILFLKRNLRQKKNTKL